MSLITKRASEVPPGATLLSEKQAFKYQKDLVENWPVGADVFFLKYAKHITSSATLLSSFIITKYYFKTFNLSLSLHTIFALVATNGISSTAAYQLTDNNLTKNILLMKMDCPLCLQLKFGLLQGYFGIGFPVVFGYFTLSSAVYFQNSYNLPHYQAKGKEFWVETFNIVKRGVPAIRVSGLIQAALVLFLPFLQIKQLENIMKVADKIDEKTSNFQ